MATYEFKKIPDGGFDTATVTIRVELVDTLEDVLSEVKHFLLACGFVLSPGSTIDIVELEVDE